MSLLIDIFSESYLFDEETTRANITKWKDKYFPATLYYLEKKYGLPIELKYDKNKTGLEYLIEKLNIEQNNKISLSEIETKNWNQEINNSVRIIIKKEK